MDKIEKAGQSFLTGILALTVVFMLFFAVSSYEAKELEVSQKKPKHPMEGVVVKKCKETGIYCPVVDKQMANHVEWGR